jgi:hypothetical protein
VRDSRGSGGTVPPLPIDWHRDLQCPTIVLALKILPTALY